MKLKRRKIRRSTCFMLGIVGAAVTFAAGVLRALGTGPAALPDAAGIALCGGMLLFLAAAERGPENKGRRIWLMVLFLLLLLSYLRLPPLDLLEAPVVVCAAALYRQKSDGPLLWGLGAADAAFAVARMLERVGYLPWDLPWLVGALMAAVAVLRGAVLLRLYLRTRDEKPDDTQQVHSLR